MGLIEGGTEGGTQPPYTDKQGVCSAPVPLIAHSWGVPGQGRCREVFGQGHSGCAQPGQGEAERDRAAPVNDSHSD